MTIHKTRWAVAVGGVIFALTLAAGVKADGNIAHTTYLTFSQPVRLPGVALGAGTFIFELVNPENGMGAVRVVSADRQISYFLGLTTPVERPRRGNPGTLITLGESAKDVAPPIVAWWPLGQSTGYAFNYR
jgi:hypothetical protein